MTQLALLFPDPKPVYVTVVIERGWCDKHDRPRQWAHTLSRPMADELIAEVPQLWPEARVWVEP